MLKIQEYLLSGKTLDDLKNDYSIKYRIKNNKVILHYDQISSPMNEKICQECRGLILYTDSYEIVCFPFMKFFNYREGNAANIDWKTAKFLLKIDGTNVNLYFDKRLDKWCFATGKSVEADIPNEMKLTFAEIAFLALKEMNIDFDDLTKKLNKNHTYMFELVSPYSQVYVYYDKPRLHLLAERDNISCKEIDCTETSKLINIPMPEMYNFESLDQMIPIINSWNGTEKEGIVVLDGNFNRIKVKNIAYLEGQSLVFSLSASDRNIIKMIILKQDDDIMPQCAPLIQDKIKLMKDKFVKLLHQTENDYNEIKNIESMKDCAEIINTKKWKTPLFLLKRKKIMSIYDWLLKNVDSNAMIDSIISLF